jgi:hypothetical protein
VSSTAPDNEKPKVSARRHLRPEEAQKLIAAAGKRGRYPERDKLLLRLAYRHGLRASEAVGLRWDSFDLDGGSLTITGPARTRLPGMTWAPFGRCARQPTGARGDAVIDQRIASAVTQHVRVDCVAHTGLNTGFTDDVLHRINRQRTTAFGLKYPWAVGDLGAISTRCGPVPKPHLLYLTSALARPSQLQVSGCWHYRGTGHSARDRFEAFEFARTSFFLHAPQMPLIFWSQRTIKPRRQPRLLWQPRPVQEPVNLIPQHRSYASSFSNAFASFRSATSKPSVNRSWIGPSRS